MDLTTSRSSTQAQASGRGAGSWSSRWKTCPVRTSSSGTNIRFRARRNVSRSSAWAASESAAGNAAFHSGRERSSTGWSCCSIPHATATAASRAVRVSPSASTAAQGGSGAPGKAWGSVPTASAHSESGTEAVTPPPSSASRTSFGLGM